MSKIYISQERAMAETKEYQKYREPFERKHEEAMMGLREYPVSKPKTFAEYFGHTLWFNEDGSCFISDELNEEL